MAQPGRRLAGGGRPDARVRHREAVASGLATTRPGRGSARAAPGHTADLQRRHELRAVLKNYSRLTLVRVLSQAALLAPGEVLVALLARDPERARAVAGAWRWNVRRLTEISAAARRAGRAPLFPDSEVRRLQLRERAALAPTSAASRTRDSKRPKTATVARVRDERARRSAPADRQRRSGLQRGHRLRRPGRPGPSRRARPVRPPRALCSARHRASARPGRPGGGARHRAGHPRALVRDTAPGRPVGAAALVVRGVAPLLSGWQQAGVGTTAPASPLFGFVGITGTVLFGAMGTLQRVLLLGCIRVGTWGVSRFMRPLVGPRARVVAVICYLGLPLAYGALGTGRWDGLVAYALFPFIALRLARAAGIAPFASSRAHTGDRVPRSDRSPRRGHRPGHRFAPAVEPMVLIAAVAWALGALIVGCARPARVLVVACAGVGVSLALLAPWVVARRWPVKGRCRSSDCL